MVEVLEPISKKEYHHIVAGNFSRGSIDETAIEEQAMKLVDELPKLAAGNYWWRIYTKLHLCKKAGGSVEQLTPYTAAELMNSPAPDELMIAAIHPDEREICYSFVGEFSAYVSNLPPERRNKQSINLYMRIRQKDNSYKWMNVQFPFTLLDEHGKEKGGLIVYTDLSHTDVQLTAPEMMIIDSSNGEMLRFKGAEASVDPVKNLQNKIKGLTKRQAQILYLISKGKASKQIAAELKIAKNTVENHRQRMLKKFEAKSSIELIDILKDGLR
jgi:DNA-binding CsgD family transcriptional regulator